MATNNYDPKAFWVSRAEFSKLFVCKHCLRFAGLLRCPTSRLARIYFYEKFMRVSFFVVVNLSASPKTNSLSLDSADG